MNPTENPPAFPVLGYTRLADGSLNPEPTIYDGMTLRDYFAAKALQGILAGNTILGRVIPDGKFKGMTEEQLAVEESFKIADAMLTHRAQQKD